MGMSQVNRELSVQEVDIICSLELNEYRPAADYKRRLAWSLAEAYSVGGDDFAKDTTKAAKYAELSWMKYPEHFHHYKPVNHETSNARMFYHGFGVMNETRIIGFRAKNFLDVTGFLTVAPAIVGASMTVLGKVFSFLGLAYAIRLGVDIYMVCRDMLSPGLGEEKTPFLKRLKNNFAKDNRSYRMANDSIWLGINLATAIMTLGFSLAIPMAAKIAVLCGFHFDFLVEVVKVFDLSPHESALNKVKLHVDDLNEQLQEHTSSFYFIHSEYEEERKAISQEIEKFQVIEKKLKEKISSLKTDRMVGMVSALGVFVGTALIFFPPTAIVGLVILASSMSLVCSTLLTNFGKKIRNMFDRKQSAVEQTKPEPVEIATSDNQVYHQLSDGPVANPVVKETVSMQSYSSLVDEVEDQRSDPSPTFSIATTENSDDSPSVSTVSSPSSSKRFSPVSMFDGHGVDTLFHGSDTKIKLPPNTVLRWGPSCSIENAA